MNLVGIKSVLNIRHPREDQFVNEEKFVKDVGLNYSNIPLMNAEDIDENFLEQVKVTKTYHSHPFPQHHLFIYLLESNLFLFLRNHFHHLSFHLIQNQLNTLPRPVLLHCYVGFTAAASAFLLEGKSNQTSSIDVLAWGSDLGFNFTSNAKLYEFIKKYLG